MGSQTGVVDLMACCWCLVQLVALSSCRPAHSAPSSGRHRTHHHHTSAHSHLRHERRQLLAQRAVYGNPCRGRHTAEETDEGLAGAGDVLTDRTVALTSLPHQLRLISRDAAAAKEQVGLLMGKYLTERFRQTIKHDDFSAFRLKGLPKVPKVTNRDFQERIDVKVHTSLNGTYDRLVTMDMFLHDIRLDEAILHGELGYTSYIETISNVHVSNLLCRLRVAMVDFGVRFQSNHVEQAKKHEVRNVRSDAIRYFYDYIILRELQNALAYMEVEFAVLTTRTLHIEGGVEST